MSNNFIPDKDVSPSIAVIGMACIFPGAHSPEELWENVLAGRRYFRIMPPERLPRKDYYDPDLKSPGKSYCDQMALITGWKFDPLEYGIPPVTVEASDIVHWLALHTAKEALDDAALDLGQLDRRRIGVILGNTLAGEYQRSNNLRFRWPYVERSIRRALDHQDYDRETIHSIIDSVQYFFETPLPGITEDSLAGNMSNTIAGRICNYFDFSGGGYTIDGACSSSILAIAHACNALMNGDMDIAVSGGVDVSLDPFEIVGFSKTQALTKDDIRPYDEKASGMLPGEGCGIFILAREDYARNAGLRTYALIRGWGYSSDGSGGITAPKVEGQMLALQKAYDRAGYPISSVGLFEGHGTGTALGDQVEIEAIRRLLEASPDYGTCRIGSIKGNIGHCKAAAGSAGLVKAIMALRRKIYPPTANCDSPSPLFEKSPGRLCPETGGGIWDSTLNPRRASVSAMGFGGSNAHITLEEANKEGLPLASDLGILGSDQTTELILLSADTAGELTDKVRELLSIANRICRAELVDLSAALARDNMHGRVRLAFVAKSPWNLVDLLEKVYRQLESGMSVDDIINTDAEIFAGHVIDEPTLVALFPGQGSQRLNMGRDFLDRYSLVKELFQKADSALAGIMPDGLSRKICFDCHSSHAADKSSKKSALMQTQLAQPAIVLTSIAILNVLKSYGLTPDISIGHSLGEISALHAAGAYDEVTAIRIASVRGQAVSSSSMEEQGSMAALMATPDDVLDLIGPSAGDIVISNYNSPNQTVVSGTSGAVATLLKTCKEQGVIANKLPVSHAFHSRLIAPAADLYRKALDEFDIDNISRPVVSTCTGQLVNQDMDVRSLLAQQLQSPVRFMDAVTGAAETKPSLWIEVGPGGVLTGLARDILGHQRVLAMPTDLSDENGLHLLNRVLAQAYVMGFKVATDRLFHNRFHRPFSLDNHNPLFIPNPCENSVEPPDVRPEKRPGRIANPLFSQEIPSHETDRYLSHRGDYIRELISLDYKHFMITGPVSGQQGPALDNTAGDKEKTSPHKSDQQDIHDYAVSWISRRTGFPLETVSLDARLKDDLKLDSIKAGELALMLARKMKRSAPSDPGAFANSTLREMINKFNATEMTGPPSTEVTAGLVDQGDIVGGLDGWVRTFRVDLVPAPLESERVMDLPETGSVLIIAEDDDSRISKISQRLSENGLNPVRFSYDLIHSDSELPESLCAAVWLLSDGTEDFLSCSSDEFEGRVNALASDLFHVYRWIASNREEKLSGFRTLILRSYDTERDTAQDIDSGSAFLKTLQLEYAESHFKWVCVPDDWTPSVVCNVMIDELKHSSETVSFMYSKDRERKTESAHPFIKGNGEAVNFSGKDIALVTGGAKGITFELAFAWALKTGIRLLLLGSSSLPDNTSGDSQDEMVRNFQRLKEARVKYDYISCDITDITAVKSCIGNFEKGTEKISAILHGAGKTKPTPFEKMDFDEFLSCISIKTRGLYNVLSAVSLRHLKAVYAISSVLGRTGMVGQADYTYANAWLDGAMKVISHLAPDCASMSIGYSVWAETGLGKRLGAVDSLSSAGVVPISNKEGIDAFLNLLNNNHRGATFVATGRLTPDLEKKLFPGRSILRGRFLESILRWVPEVELVTEAALSRQSDLYLQEHVFEGTTLFPGVMAIEAMVSAAMACAGRKDLPVLKNVKFNRPLIIAENAGLPVRIYGLAKQGSGGSTEVTVAVRSDMDGFRASHFEAECVFDESSTRQPEAINPDDIPEPLDIDLDEFDPAPLFQGKLFRRIANIRKREEGVQGITELEVPELERYYDKNHGQKAFTHSPALRDSYLQSYGLILPMMCLPSGFKEIRFIKSPEPGSRVYCFTEIVSQEHGRYVANINIYDAEGQLVEQFLEAEFTKTESDMKDLSRLPVQTLDTAGLTELLNDFHAEGRHAVSVVEHGELSGHEAPTEISDAAHVQAGGNGREPANLLAARRSAVEFARRHMGLQISAGSFGLAHAEGGKPEICFASDSLKEAFKGIVITLTDSNHLSVALTGQMPLGIDLEFVESRNAETWRGLLGDDGYDLALRLSNDYAEAFDASATRVWTLIEAGKKAMSLTRIIPQHVTSDGKLLLFKSDLNGQELMLASGIVALDRISKSHGAISLAFGRPPDKPVESVSQKEHSVGGKVSAITNNLMQNFKGLQRECVSDPDSPGTDRNYRHFCRIIGGALKSYQDISNATNWNGGREHQHKASHAMLRMLQETESVAFRRSIEKPLGYPGDYRLMDMMLENKVSSSGIGYHFDRMFLEYTGSEAVRQRTYWVVDKLKNALELKKNNHLTVLDLGCGPMNIETLLLQQAPDDASFTFIGLDADKEAMGYAESRLAGRDNVIIQLQQCNLLSTEGMQYIISMAARADVCVCMGFFDYLDGETISAVLEAIHTGSGNDIPVYFANYHPDHSARLVMEWLLDWWLIYNTEEEIIRMTQNAGFDTDKIRTEMDKSGSIVLAEAVT